MQTNANMAPLEWSEQIRHMGGWERFLTVGFYWLCPYRRERREMEKRVQRRGDVTGQWPTDPHVRSTLAVVKRALMEEMGWPSSDFIPSDRCEVLFMSRWNDALDSYDAIRYISKNLGLPTSSLYSLADLSLGELIEQLCSAQRK